MLHTFGFSDTQVKGLEKSGNFWRTTTQSLVAQHRDHAPYCTEFNQPPTRPVVGTFSMGGFCQELPTFYQLTYPFRSDKVAVGHSLEYPLGRNPEKRPLTDAGHHYESIYARHLERLRHRSFTMLEIGTYLGKSMYFFKAFLPNVRYIALDTHHPLFYQWQDEGGRTRGDPPPTKEELDAYNRWFGVDFVEGNQANVSVLAQALRIAGGCIDVIVDDGAHDITSIVSSFAYLFPRMSAGGLYFIEDLSLATFLAVALKGNHDTPNSFVHRTKRMLDTLNRNLLGDSTQLGPANTSFSPINKVDHLVESFFCQEEACIYTKTALLPCDAALYENLTQPTAHMAGMRIKTATLGQNCGVRFGEHTTAVARECDGKADCSFLVDGAKLLGSRLMRLDGCLPAFVAQYVCASEDFVRYTTLHADASGRQAILSCPSVSCVLPNARNNASHYADFIRRFVERVPAVCDRNPAGCDLECATELDKYWVGCVEETWPCLRQVPAVLAKLDRIVHRCKGAVETEGCVAWNFPKLPSLEDPAVLEASVKAEEDARRQADERFRVMPAGLSPVVTAFNTACRDTENWHNPGGMDCIGYEKLNYCRLGRAMPGKEWSLGSQHGNPERHCCVCGKDSATDPETTSTSSRRPLLRVGGGPG